MGRWTPYNPNPQRRSVGDCAVRACTVAAHMSWDEVYMALTFEGFGCCDLISANHVWGNFLRKQGYVRDLIDDCTVEQFAAEHPKGTYVLALSGHVVAVQDGCYLDSWDSGAEIPIYYWRKKEGD